MCLFCLVTHSPFRKARKECEENNIKYKNCYVFVDVDAGKKFMQLVPISFCWCCCCCCIFSLFGLNDHLDFFKFPWSVARQWKLDETPTLTASRGRTGFYVTKLRRRLTVKESLRLQGIRLCRKTVKMAKLSASQVGAAAGNAMSQNVLERLLPRVLRHAGLTGLIRDPWEDRSYNPFAKSQWQWTMMM